MDADVEAVPATKGSAMGGYNPISAGH